MKKPREAKRVSDEAVQKRTGKTWAEWFKLLNGEGAQKMIHRDIAALLYQKHKLSGWWAQMVTVEYERERGLREMRQTATGFTASGSKTISVPISALYRAWADGKTRRRWLKDARIEFRKATPKKSIRATWNSESSVAINFYANRKNKSQVTVDHEKLASARESSKMKNYWFQALKRLKNLLEA